jgi:hypothetical protein
LTTDASPSTLRPGGFRNTFIFKPEIMNVFTATHKLHYTSRRFDPEIFAPAI